MKFSCLKKNIEYAVSTAERFTGKNTTLPILGTVYCEAKDHAIILRATNLEHAVEVEVPGTVVRPGTLCLPAKILLQFLQSMNDEKVDIEEKQGNCSITTQTRRARINGMNTNDFPLMPTLKKTASISVDTTLFAHGIEKVLPSVSTSEFKPELSGVFFTAHNGTLSAASTDTFRLSEKKIPLEKKQPIQPFSCILPYKITQEVYRVFGEREDEPVHISVGDGQILFEGSGIRIISRLIDGTFPDYSAIIPKAFDTSCFINRNEFLTAVRSASIFASKIQEITLQFQKKELHITSHNADIGEQTITIPTTLTGKEASVSFNYRYLLDGLSALDEDEIFMGVNQENSPSLFKNKSDNSYLYVVMPIKI